MIDAELQTSLVQAVLALLDASTAEEQAEILARDGARFLTLGADGVLAVLCVMSSADPAFVSRLETIRISFDDLRQNVDDPAQVVPLLRRFLPFGGPAAPLRPAGAEVPSDVSSHIAGIVWAYVSAPAWRIRRGIAEAFPAVFTESDRALEVLALLRTVEGVDQLPWVAAAVDHLVAMRAGGAPWPRGLTGSERQPSIRTPVSPMFTADEYIELSLYEYQECRSVETRAELLASNPVLITDRALKYCKVLAEHHRQRGRPAVAESYESVARSLEAARTGDLDVSAGLVLDIGYLPTEAQGARLLHAMATGNLRDAANLARHALHLVDRQRAPLLWARANVQQARILAHAASRVAGTGPIIVEEIVLRCLAALRVLGAGTAEWAAVCVILAEAMLERIRGNRNTNLETATSILTEVAEAGMATEDVARVHLVLANAYRLHFGDSAADGTRHALDHARRALAMNEETGDSPGTDHARLIIAQVLVKAAEEVRGGYRGELLDIAEEYLGRIDLTRPEVPTTEDRSDDGIDAGIAHVTQVLGLNDDTAAALRAGGSPTGQPLRTYVRQLLATCRMLRYSDGTQGPEASGAGLSEAVELHEQILSEIDRDLEPRAWASVMYSLANMYTRYPVPTDEMLDRAGQAQHAALEVFRAEHASHEIGLVTMALGNGAFRRHRWEEAATWLREATELFAQGEQWSTSDRGVLAQIAELRETYARLGYALHRAGGHARDCLEWLERGKTRLAVGRDPAPLDLDELADAVPPGGAVVVPLITSQGSLLWTVTRGTDGTPEITTTDLDDLTDRELDAMMYGSESVPGWTLAYNASLSLSDDETFDTWLATIDRVCSDLWWSIGRHVTASLRAAGVAEGAPVAIAPSRQLSVLPLHAAWRRDSDSDRHYLGDDYPITYTPSLRTLVTASARRRARATATPALLAIADPLGDLEHAVVEVDAIAEYFSPERRETLSGGTATIDRLGQHAAGRTHLHIACHGSFDSDNPSSSSLHLADGPLRLDGLRTLLPLDDFDVITLSACETGLLDLRRAPYEWLGIAGALARAGATDIVCTLWRIEDEASARLMDHFYRSLIVDRAPPAQALRAARSALRGEPELRHPFYWAAFTHVGVPRQAV